MKYSPHKYQTYATDFILEHPISAVFLDMGLGVGDEKTCKGLDYEPLTRMPDLKYLDLMNHLDLTADLCKRIAAGSPNLRARSSCT